MKHQEVLLRQAENGRHFMAENCCTHSLFAAREALIAEGNTAFNQQRDRTAMTHYQQALEVAQAILAEKPG